MTQKEQEQLKDDAAEEAAILGGLVLLLLGRRSGLRQDVRWDASRAVFIVDEKIITIAKVRAELIRIEKRQASRIVRLSNDLQRGAITLGQWMETVRTIVSSTHVLMSGMATGSISSAIDTKVVQQRVDKEREYLSGFVSAISTDGKKIANRIKARASSYLLAASITFAIVDKAIKEAVGYSEARRVRRASESCGGCREYAGRWMPIEEMPSIGSLDCRWRCRCYLEYR